jgi:acetolactate synthase small subunit
VCSYLRLCVKVVNLKENISRILGVLAVASEDSMVVADTHKSNEIKMKISVSGEKTQEIFDKFFFQAC